MVPKGWKIEQVGDLFDVQLGKMLNKEAKEKTPQFHYLGNSNVKWGYFDMSDLKTMHFSEREVEKFTLEVGDLLICEGGEVGRCAIWQGSSQTILYQKALHRLRSKGQIIPQFFQSYMEKISSTKLLDDYTTRTSIAHLTREKLISLPVKLPPFVEQKKIARILSTWDKAITTTEQLLANSQQQKKALMQQLLTGKKRLLDKNGVRFSAEWESSATPYKKLPNDWSEKGLSEISSFITKGATPTTYGYEWQDSGIPFIRSECVGESGFKASGLAYIGDDAHKAMSRSKVFSGDILITITGNVGRVSKLPESIPEANINQHIAKITLDKNLVCPDFVFHCLQDQKYRNHFERITTGQAYPQISLVQVRDAMIPIPTVYEQQKIAEVLSIADREIAALQQRFDALKQEKKALMQQLLTGKRRVKTS